MMRTKSAGPEDTSMKWHCWNEVFRVQGKDVHFPSSGKPFIIKEYESRLPDGRIIWIEKREDWKA